MRASPRPNAGRNVDVAVVTLFMTSVSLQKT